MLKKGHTDKAKYLCNMYYFWMVDLYPLILVPNEDSTNMQIPPNNIQKLSKNYTDSWKIEESNRTYMENIIKNKV